MRPLLLPLALLLLPSIAAAQAGRFLLAAGDVAVVRAGATLRAEVGTPIQSGDVIRVGERSNAQIRLSDASIVALRPGTELRIDEYAYSGKPDETSRSFLSLVRGGLRTLTGAIGSLHDRHRYEVRTPTASIGIRGTHYVLVQCDGNCPGGASGTYGGVSDGTIGVQNQTPEREFAAHEYFHVASSNTPPEALIAPPDFLYDRLPAQQRSSGSGTASSQGMARSGLDAESRPSSVPTPPEPPPFVVTEERDASGNPVVVQATGDTALVGAIAAAGNPAPLGFVSSSQLTFSGTALQSFSAVGPNGGFSGDSGGAVTDETISNPIGASWGRWNGGTYTDANGTMTLSDANQFHYLVAPLTPTDVITARTGTMSLSYVTGTTPTNNRGDLGLISGGTMGIDFTNRTVTWPSVSFQFNDVQGAPIQTWSFQAQPTTPLVVSGSAVYSQSTVGGTCTGTDCGSTAELLRSGVFIGATGDHFGVGMAAHSGAASVQATGIYQAGGRPQAIDGPSN